MEKDNLEKELRNLLKDAIKVSSGHTSPNTGSVYNDFYVYEWIIRDTGEIFYVGKGRKIELQSIIIIIPMQKELGQAMMWRLRLLLII